MLQGEYVELPEMLLCRERRAARLRELLVNYRLPLISFCLNMPGPVKTNGQIKKLFEYGMTAIETALTKNNMQIVFQEEQHFPMEAAMNYLSLGKRIYNCCRWINYRFLVVFWLRCIFHPHEVRHLHDFLQANRLRQRIFAVNPQFFGQLTRCFFFRGSSWQQRLALIETTMEEMEGFFSKASLERLYLDENNPLVVMELPAIRADAMEPVQLDMLFRAGEVREGAMSLRIRQGDRVIYHVNFWLQHNKAGKAMYLGCHQGSKDGLTVNKAMTKAYFGYRPKNLIIFFVRLLAKELQCQSLYAVSNYGFYAQNHFGRRNRKLLVSYDAFWQECGGTLCQDKRFYALPLEEPKKQMADVPTHKRAVYRQRFNLLTELQQEFITSLQPLKR